MMKPNLHFMVFNNTSLNWQNQKRIVNFLIFWMLLNSIKLWFLSNQSNGALLWPLFSRNKTFLQSIFTVQWTRKNVLPDTKNSKISRVVSWSPLTCLDVVWILNESTLFSTMTCQKTPIHIFIVSLELVDLVPRYSIFFLKHSIKLGF